MKVFTTILIASVLILLIISILGIRPGDKRDRTALIALLYMGIVQVIAATQIWR